MNSFDALWIARSARAGLILALAVALPSPGAAAAARGKAEHVVMIGWDGMRRDFITPQYTPTLYQLATNGAFFKNHHAVYITSTEVNNTALATGAYPETSGIMANSQFFPELSVLGPVATEGVDTVRRGDMLWTGQFLKTPTVAQILQQAGIPTMVAGTKPVALLYDRSSQRTLGAAGRSVNIIRGRAMPRAWQDLLVKVNDDKVFPTNSLTPNKDMDSWTVKAVTHGLWKTNIPKYTVIWLSEPDASQHATMPGHDTAIAAIELCDKLLGQVLKTLDDRKVRDKTDIFVVSDHGFSTTLKGPDVCETLKKAGFKAFRKFEDPEPGDILVNGLGGSVAFNVWEKNEKVIRQLAEFLQGCAFTTAVFSQIPVAGTFPMSSVRIGSGHGAPDVLLALKWDLEKNSSETPGQFIADNAGKGSGSHGSIGPADFGNTLIASGPDFKPGFIDALPSGTIDVAPTILHILGVAQPAGSPMDGRVLREALVGGTPAAGAPEPKTLQASRDCGLFRWEQTLEWVEFDGRSYIKKASGRQVPK